MLELICEGLSTKEIAGVMGISKQATSQLQRRVIKNADARSIVQVCLMWAGMRRLRLEELTLARGSHSARPRAKRLLLQRSEPEQSMRKEGL
jgi:hypothetical protein